MMPYEERLMREAADIWIIATDNTIPISVALRAIADRLSSSLSASPRTDGEALPVPACTPATLLGREVHFTKEQTP